MRTPSRRPAAIDYCDAVGRVAERAFSDMHGLAPDLADVLAVARRLDHLAPDRAATERIRRLVRDCIEGDVSSAICGAMLVKVHLDHLAEVSDRRSARRD